MSAATAQDLVEQGLAEAARRAGVRDAQVIVREQHATNLRWALSDMTGNGRAQSLSVAVAIGLDLPGGLGVGVVERTGVGSGDMSALVDAAVAAARQAGPAEDQLPLVAPAGSSTEAGWSLPAEPVGAEVITRLTGDVGEVVANARSAGRESFGFARHHLSTTWLGTSTGIRRRHASSRGAVEVTSMSHARSRSAWAGRGTVDFADVDLVALDAEVATRLDWQARKVDLPAGRRTVVLPPDAVADLVVYLYFSAEGRAAAEGRTVFSAPDGGTRLGQRLTDVPVTLRSDPREPGIEGAPFVATLGSDGFTSLRDNGLDILPTTWVDDGVLRALATTRHSAERAGLPHTQAGENLRMDVAGAVGDTADLVAGVDDGLLLTCLWYIREVDSQTLLVTGLTRDGVYQVRGGEVVAAVNNFRFNESPVDLLGRISGASATRGALSREWNEFFDRTAMPALVVDDFNLSSVSEAS